MPDDAAVDMPICARALTNVRVAVIPAAGRGTRLLPITRSIPKALLPLVDEPLIDRAISDALSAGIDEVIVVVGSQMPALEEHLRSTADRVSQQGRDGPVAGKIRSPARISVITQPEPLGNGDAVLCARALVEDRPFLVVWPDDVVVAKPSVAAQLLSKRDHLGGGSIAGVAHVSLSQARRSGVVQGEQLDETTWLVRQVMEKPAMPPTDLALVYGYVLEPAIFDTLQAMRPSLTEEVWLSRAVDVLARDTAVHAHVFEGVHYDAGDRQGYVRAFVAAALEREELRDDLAAWLEGLLANRRPSPT